MTPHTFTECGAPEHDKCSPSDCLFGYQHYVKQKRAEWYGVSGDGPSPSIEVPDDIAHIWIPKEFWNAVDDVCEARNSIIKREFRYETYLLVRLYSPSDNAHLSLAERLAFLYDLQTVTLLPITGVR